MKCAKQPAIKIDKVSWICRACLKLALSKSGGPNADSDFQFIISFVLVFRSKIDQPPESWTNLSSYFNRILTLRERKEWLHAKVLYWNVCKFILLYGVHATFFTYTRGKKKRNLQKEWLSPSLNVNDRNYLVCMQGVRDSLAPIQVLFRAVFRFASDMISLST